ncbi:MAG: hypothetical protein K6G80_07235 [Treponema sp.]|nr:hypothetical protein [Treponema sp.]
MNISVKKGLPACICIVSLFAFYLFRTVPQSRLWKGYTVLYVTSEILSEADVVSVLTQNGCEGVITKSAQREPVVSPLSPLQMLSQDSYLHRRNAFFQDAGKSSMVFYVPDTESQALSRSIHSLEAASGTKCGTDSASSLPYLAPVCSILFMAAAVALSKGRRRIYMILAAVFFLALNFSRPMFTVAACSSLSAAGFFIMLKLFGRKGCVQRVSRSPLAVLLLVAPVFILCASNPVNALLYVLACAAAVSAMYVYDVAEALYYSRFENAFSPVPIRSAFGMRLVSERDVQTLSGLSLTCILLLAASVLGGRVQAAGSATDRPALPAPVSRADGLLPDLDDFIAWSWKTASFPYRRLQTQELTDAVAEVYPEEGTRITVPVFSETANGVTAGEETKLVFNNEFRESVFDAVKKASYPALEQMLLKQGRTARYAFVRGGAVSAERLGTALLLACAVISAGLTLYFVLGRRMYGFGK